MKTVIRPYEPSDLEVVADIWGEGWRSTGIASDGIDPHDLREQLRQQVADGWAVHVAVVDGRAAAYAALDGDILERLFVHPDFQGKGIGKCLLDFIKTQRPGGFWLTTAAESRAPKFYEREGLVRGETFAHPKWGDVHARYDWWPEEAPPP